MDITDVKWTEDIIRATVTAWDNGFSAAEISNHILDGQKSRLAVIGWLHRNQDRLKRKKGMTFDKRRGQWSKRKAHEASWDSYEGVRQKQSISNKLRRPPIVSCEGISLLDLNMDRCHFPLLDVKVGQGDQQMFCGNETLEGSSYCQAHHEFCRRQQKSCSQGDLNPSMKTEVA